jgi:hypothetical protein
MRAGMTREPTSHFGMFVSAAVIHDEVQLLSVRGLTVDLTQKGEPLIMAVTRLAGGNHLSIQHAQSGKQRGRAAKRCSSLRSAVLNRISRHSHRRLLPRYWHETTNDSMSSCTYEALH